MAKEWFTLDELRGLRLPGVDEAYLRCLAKRFGEIPSSLARRRSVTGVSPVYHEAEFLIALLPEAACEEVLRRNIPDLADLVAQARKLGISAPVRDQRSYYAGPDVAPELSQLERLLELHHAQGVR